jgi:hypothetical protein
LPLRLPENAGRSRLSRAISRRVRHAAGAGQVISLFIYFVATLVFTDSPRACGRSPDHHYLRIFLAMFGLRNV